jgi:hypothetical protein
VRKERRENAAYKKRGLFEASRIVFLSVEEILPNPISPAAF